MSQALADAARRDDAGPKPDLSAPARASRFVSATGTRPRRCAMGARLMIAVRERHGIRICAFTNHITILCLAAKRFFDLS